MASRVAEVWGQCGVSVGSVWRSVCRKGLDINTATECRKCNGRGVRRVWVTGDYSNTVVGRQCKNPLRRPRSRREDNITMGIKEVRWQAVDWINLPQDRDKWRAVVSTELYWTVLFVMYSTVLNCTFVMYCTVLNCTELNRTVMKSNELYWTVLNSTVLYRNVLNCTELNRTVMNSNELYWTVLNSTELNRTVMKSNELYWTVLNCTEMNCTEPYCTELNWTEL